MPILKGKPEADYQEYWDPNNSGNPLLDTSGARKNMKLSPHFTVRELSASGGRSFDVARIDLKLVYCLEKIRVALGKPVKITSGYRSWKRNKIVGGKPTSRHLSGQAADIWVAGITGYEIAEVAIRACGCKIGIGLGMGRNQTGVHIDVRGKWAKWDYGGQKAKQELYKAIRFHKEHCA